MSVCPGQPSLTLEMGPSISVGCAVRKAAQRWCSVNLHALIGQQFPCYVTMHGAADPPRKTGGPILALLWGVAAEQGTGERKLLEPVVHPDEMRGSHACLGSSWRLWKKGEFLGMLYLSWHFPGDCCRQGVLRCFSSGCLCEWSALCCGVKPLPGQAVLLPLRL